jgi:hypothetical protein
MSLVAQDRRVTACARRRTMQLSNRQLDRLLPQPGGFEGLVPAPVVPCLLVAAPVGDDVSPLERHLYPARLALGPDRGECQNGLSEVLDPLDLEAEALVVPRPPHRIPEFDRALASSIDRVEAGKDPRGDELPLRGDVLEPLFECPPDSRRQCFGGTAPRSPATSPTPAARRLRGRRRDGGTPPVGAPFLAG